MNDSDPSVRGPGASIGAEAADRLRAIAAAHPRPLLFATVSGAHLYGFASPDSDYDLRGVHLLPAEEVEAPVGDDLAGSEVAVATPVEHLDVVRDPFLRSHGGEHLDRLGGDFRAGAVSGNRCDRQGAGGHGGDRLRSGDRAGEKRKSWNESVLAAALGTGGESARDLRRLQRGALRSGAGGVGDTDRGAEVRGVDAGGRISCC
jgi:hypothetical protein